MRSVNDLDDKDSGSLAVAMALRNLLVKVDGRFVSDSLLYFRLQTGYDSGTVCVYCRIVFETFDTVVVKC